LRSRGVAVDRLDGGVTQAQSPTPPHQTPAPVAPPPIVQLTPTQPVPPPLVAVTDTDEVAALLARHQAMMAQQAATKLGINAPADAPVGPYRSSFL
jgi:hypothetical protein